MSRLFTFGCSFTQYAWPTWADIVAYDLGIEYYNYGIAGLGNVGIQHRMLEADLKHSFTKDDIILVLWTSWCREDRVKDAQWNASGSVLNIYNDVYDRKFVRKYWDYSNDIVKNSTAIITANELYKDNIKWQGTGIPLFLTENSRFAENKRELYLVELYKNKISPIEEITTFKNDVDNKAFSAIDDCHPDVKDYLKIVENHIYKSINLTLKPETKSRFIDLQKTIEIYFKGRTTHVSVVGKTIEHILIQKFPDIMNTMNVQSLVD
jgi:hypothetical protein